LTKERVLVVDDSPQNRLVATGHLESAGYEVLTASSGEEALERLAVDTVDLVILDVLMPGLGGFATCKRIRASPPTADLPVLFLTALGDREATGPAIEAGGDDLLPKPFHRAELLLRSRALIRQRKMTHVLKQTMRALVAQNEALRRSDHDKRKMGELIVHDLKSSIGAVLANAELLRPHATGEQHEMLDDILVAAHTIDRTAKNLLDLSRAEEVAVVAHVEAFPLSKLTDEVVASVRGLARWTDIELVVDVPSEPVTADPELVRRLLQNLVHNAVKHAPEGSAVRIEANLDGDALLLRVIDHGPGVPPDMAERIFDRYATGETGGRRPGSHGLGLTFCRLAASAHGGTIWVEAREGGGATFCVRIPQPAR
jgi:signal transduction histidine kinase